MTTDLRDMLLRQQQIASALLHYHLDTLTDEECLWRPAPRGLHVHQTADGWRADWPETEDYGIGPASIGWTTWHICFWWSMLLDHTFGKAELQREDIRWPGSASASIAAISDLEARWLAHLNAMDDEALRATDLARWPFGGAPFADIVGWASIELTKNASEIGYARFLYGVRRV